MNLSLYDIFVRWGHSPTPVIDWALISKLEEGPKGTFADPNSLFDCRTTLLSQFFPVFDVLSPLLYEWVLFSVFCEPSSAGRWSFHHSCLNTHSALHFVSSTPTCRLTDALHCWMTPPRLNRTWNPRWLCLWRVHKADYNLRSWRRPQLGRGDLAALPMHLNVEQHPAILKMDDQILYQMEREGEWLNWYSLLTPQNKLGCSLIFQENRTYSHLQLWKLYWSALASGRDV